VRDRALVISVGDQKGDMNRLASSVAE